MSDALKRRPRLAYPFTILTGENVVRLVAGEDHRYTLRAAGIELWLPQLLQHLKGKNTLADLLATLAPEHRASAAELVTQLFGERVLVDGTALDAHLANKYRVVVEGAGQLYDQLNSHFSAQATTNGMALYILSQDRLDYEAAIQISRRCRKDKKPLLWVSYGALSRAYVSPLFLPDAGPCFGCLLNSFARLSPAPEIYEALREHLRQNKRIESVSLPEEAIRVLDGLVRWKLSQAEVAEPPPALYRLHVLEFESHEIATHRVFVDPFCSECSEAKLR